jgi:hypothetical protein
LLRLCSASFLVVLRTVLFAEACSAILRTWIGPRADPRGKTLLLPSGLPIMTGGALRATADFAASGSGP